MDRRFIPAVLLALLAGGATAQDAANEAPARRETPRHDDARQQDVSRWPPLAERFESTGGGGIIIDGYRPVVIGDRCVTRFTATTPAGEVHVNYALFEAAPLQGGTLCTAGRWGAVDGSATGTTPLVVWLKDGAIHRAPPD